MTLKVKTSSSSSPNSPNPVSPPQHTYSQPAYVRNSPSTPHIPISTIPKLGLPIITLIGAKMSVLVHHPKAHNVQPCSRKSYLILIQKFRHCFSHTILCIGCGGNRKCKGACGETFAFFPQRRFLRCRLRLQLVQGSTCSVWL